MRQRRDALKLYKKSKNKKPRNKQEMRKHYYLHNLHKLIYPKLIMLQLIKLERLVSVSVFPSAVRGVMGKEAFVTRNFTISLGTVAVSLEPF